MPVAIASAIAAYRADRRAVAASAVVPVALVDRIHVPAAVAALPVWAVRAVAAVLAAAVVAAAEAAGGKDNETEQNYEDGVFAHACF